MGLLINPNDVKADVHDIAEVIRRKGGSASIYEIMETLQISENRAKELCAEANPPNQYKSRVWQHTGTKRYHLRY